MVTGDDMTRRATLTPSPSGRSSRCCEDEFALREELAGEVQYLVLAAVEDLRRHPSGRPDPRFGDARDSVAEVDAGTVAVFEGAEGPVPHVAGHVGGGPDLRGVLVVISVGPNPRRSICAG